MIYKILDQNEVEQLKNQLKSSLPGTAKIFYVIRNYLKGLLPGKEVIVDTWPEWSSIIVRTCNDSETQAFFRHTYMCHSSSPSALKYFLQRPDVVNWRKPAAFTGVSRDVAPVISSMSQKHMGTLTTVEPRFMYAWTKKDLPPMASVPDGLTLDTLTAADAVTLRRDWEGCRYREDLEGYFRTVIENFDSSSLRDQNGDLLAYACMQFNGSIAMLYVKPEHRDTDYFKIVLSDLARRSLAKGEIAYGYIPTNDSSLVGQMRSMDFVWVPGGDMVWLHYEPLKVNRSNIHVPAKPSVPIGLRDYRDSIDCVVSNMFTKSVTSCHNDANIAISDARSSSPEQVLQEASSLVTFS